MMGRRSRTGAIATLFFLGAISLRPPAATAAITNFSTDVATSIDNGLAAFASAGAYGNPSVCGDAAGLALLALLEKRVDANPNSLSQGYNSANVPQQGLMRTATAYLLSRIPDGLYSYRDGSWLMALSLYKLTGGPDRGAHPDLPVALPYDLCGGMNAIFDRIAVQQNGGGYWCYTTASCSDSSTTQFIDAGLAALKTAYSDAINGCPDGGRLPTLNTLLANARAGYVANGTPGGAGGVLTADERGHGYNAGYTNTIQQTSSGLWVQLVGGADVNDPSVQGYLRWIRNRYEYANNAAIGDGWPSFWYAQWAMSRGLKIIQDSNTLPLPGNIGPSDIGVLAPGSAPAFAVRMLHRNPSTDPRVPLFGPGGPGYYADPNETPRVYYDQAYTIISLQDGAGVYQDPPLSNGNWEPCSRQAYALLVLERSVGGTCVDTDGDGVCDAQDNCPSVANPPHCSGDGTPCLATNLGLACPGGNGTCQQADTDGDGKGDACDCGNNVVDFGEECDGTADQACPGACLPPGGLDECQCPNLCGNNTVDPGEECDGTSASACGGGPCLPPGDPHQCECAPVCGNNTIEGGEQCDGTDDAACPGQCQVDCTCPGICGNNVREGAEQCDGTDRAQCQGVAACLPDCTCSTCGNGITDPGEDCDDGNLVNGACVPHHPNQTLDHCTNNCKGFICHDPARIGTHAGLDFFTFHGSIEPDLVNNHRIAFDPGVGFGVRLTSSSLPGDGTIFTWTVSTGISATSGGYKYRNDAARSAGGISKMKIQRRPDGTYRVTLRAYGDFSRATETMTITVVIGDGSWERTGTWEQSPSGWKLIE